ncbi:FAD-dependent oxidoreductase [uncultured Campylobacter sp.]|uniref:FAD-dependent oxidoreductase n=1 Tax=uncultured Campylobacter sp. TaxID=218934 RepID=UPI00260D5780|nr:FAD-dependent oxidoreductase [uncultured Campylobacter sp.]
MDYDIIVIGFGKAGKTLAAKSAALGKKVALIERSPQMYGGTCINVGCIPTKRLITASKEAGFVNFSVLGEYFVLSMQKKDELVEALRAKNLAMLKGSPNIDVIDGEGSFTSANSVRVLSPDGQTREISAETIVVNTGSREVEPSFEVSSGVAYSSEEILNLKILPKHLVIIGGGFIGLEFASMFAGFGSKVSVLMRSKFMKNEDEDVAASVKSALQAQGVEIIEGCEFLSLKGGELKFNLAGESKAVAADAFLYALGRRANTNDLNLAAAGVQTDAHGNIITNEHLQSSTAGIYAAGDVRGGEMFTYTSLDDFRIIFSALFGDGARTTKNRTPHASVLFTHTPLARIGLSERQARESGREIKVLKLSMAAVPGAKVVAHDEGMMKAVVDAASGEILGAALHCVNAHEIVNELAIAMALGAKADFFKNQIFTHPSISEALNDLFGQF